MYHNAYVAALIGRGGFLMFLTGLAKVDDLGLESLFQNSLFTGSFDGSLGFGLATDRLFNLNCSSLAGSCWWQSSTSVITQLACCIQSNVMMRYLLILVSLENATSQRPGRVDLAYEILYFWTNSSTTVCHSHWLKYDCMCIWVWWSDFWGSRAPGRTTLTITYPAVKYCRGSVDILYLNLR